jgi:uncharacterized protein YndB with AHSA1/START domain
MEDLGTYTEGPDGKVQLRYERVYPRPIETVWAALTQPERLADWLGACDVEPRLGGRFNCFVNRDPEAQTIGRVTAWEPPSLLEFTWGHHGEAEETRVRAELTPLGPNETRMVFTHGMMDRKWTALTFAGWHHLLEQLGGLMRNGERTLVEDNWDELKALYIDRYKLEGVLTEPPLPKEKYT